MPRHNSKIAEWKKLADIDYYGMFVKAYIPFNAWMNDNYTEPKDREKINRVKNGSNRFRDKICTLLDTTSQEGSNFRAYIGELHYCLQTCPLQNQGETISFSDVYVCKNPQNVYADSYNGIGYRVQYGTSRSKTEVESLVTNTKGTAIFHITQQDYDKSKLMKDTNFVAIKRNYQSHLLHCYDQVNPNLRISLLAGPKDKNIYKMGIFNFIGDKEKVAQGLIEILYNLRNTLFHGELDPNEYTNRIYGAAYKILRELIEAL